MTDAIGKINKVDEKSPISCEEQEQANNQREKCEYASRINSVNKVFYKSGVVRMSVGGNSLEGPPRRESGAKLLGRRRKFEN